MTAVPLGDPRRDEAPGWEPALLRHLAEWEPATPRSRPGRVAARLWATPMTAAGLVAGAAAGVRPRREEGVWLFAGARGPVRALVRRRGFSAFALGHVVVTAVPPSPALLRHELVHVRQAERLGPGFAVAYLALLAVYGYARHPMERAARAAVRRRTRPDRDQSATTPSRPSR